MPSGALSESHWKQIATKVQPGQRVEFLRFNRDKGITNGEFFNFNTKMSIGNDHVILQQRLRGALINSHMWQSIKTSEFNDTWHDGRKTHTVTAKLNGVLTTIRYRAYATATSDRIEYIIEDGESNSLSNDKSPHVFDVLTYNVYMRPTTLYQNGQTIRAKALPSQLSGYDAIVFQEVFDDHARKILLTGLKSEYPYQSKILGSDGSVIGQDGGVVIISRWPIIKQKQFLFGPVCEGADCLAEKGISYVSLDKKGTTYHLFGTHLEADYGKITRQQLDLFKEFIDHINPPKSDPVLLAGDFNVNSETNPATPFNDLLSRLEAEKPKHTGVLYSYECTVNDIISCESGRSYYDHVLAAIGYAKPTKSFNEVKLVRSEEEWKQYNFEKANWDLSDHFPVHGHFEFSTTNTTATPTNTTIASPSGSCKNGSSQGKIVGVWRKTNETVLIESGHTSKDFGALWKALSSKGYHLESFEFSDNLWSGVFKTGKGKYAMWRNFDHAGFKAKWQEMNSQGFRLYDLETYVVGGKRKWAGLFKKESGKYAMFRNLSTADFATKRKEMAKTGLKLIDIEAYSSSGELKWSGVWVTGKDGLLNRNYNYEDFKNLVIKRVQDGQKLIDIETYCITGQQKWAGIWEKSAETQFVSFDSKSSLFIKLNSNKSKKGYELLDFINY